MNYINKYSDFINSRTTEKTVEKLKQDIVPVIEDVINDEGDDLNKYIIGYHIRHVFDCQSPKVSIVKKSDNGKKPYSSIYNRNKRIGIHTINHVIDSLYYTPDKNGQNKDSLVILNMDFNCDKVPGNFMINESTTELINFKSILKRKFKNFNNPVYEEYSGDKKLKDIYSANEPYHNIENKIKQIYSKCIAGIHNLCSLMNLEGSVSYYKSLASSIYQMMSYFEDYGDNVVTIILRPTNHFQYVLGLSFFSNKKISNQSILKITQKLNEQFLTINKVFHEIQYDNYDFFKEQVKNNDSFDIEFYEKIHNDKKCPVLSYNKVNLSNELKLADKITDDARSDNIANLQKTISSFLRISINFLHQKNEGRKVRFGLLLGNPFLIKYWYGSRPIPCSIRDSKSKKILDSKFFYMKDLPNQIHLLENPEERLVVIPYIDATIQNDKRIPSFILEMGDFIEIFNNVKEGTIWLPEQRPYVYLTQRYPWSYGIVAGPDSELRLFNKGGLTAYRDGKGWKYVDYRGISKIVNNSIGGNTKLIFQILLDISFQMSPYTRDGAKGGYIIYSPSNNPETWQSKTQTLYDFEPMRWDKDNWLTGRYILNKNGEKDFDVISLVIQAGTLDGAIILSGDRGRVNYIGRRLNMENKDGNDNGKKTFFKPVGSKRTAAENLINTIKDNPTEYSDLEGTYAITISSDGPINIYHTKFDETKEIFKTLNDDDD